MAKESQTWNGIRNILKKVSSIKYLLKKLNLFFRQQATIRISSLVYNVTDYYSVTDNIFQLIVDFWHYVASK